MGYNSHDNGTCEKVLEWQLFQKNIVDHRCEDATKSNMIFIFISRRRVPK